MKVYFDGEKLKRCICEEMGLTLNDASEHIGYSVGYLSRCISNGWMPERVAKLIESELGIPKDELVNDQTESKEVLTKQELAEAIAEGVARGMERFCNSGRFNSEIYNAIRGTYIELGKIDKHIYR